VLAWVVMEPVVEVAVDIADTAVGAARGTAEVLVGIAAAEAVDAHSFGDHHIDHDTAAHAHQSKANALALALRIQTPALGSEA